jgi:hypothetical protein
MSEPVAPEQPFSAYVKEENAKELREARGDDESVESAPVVGQQTETESAASSAAPEPIEPIAPLDDRNPDGTFKPKTTKQVTNTGEWKRNAKLTAELRAAQDELQRLRSTPSAPPVTPAMVAQPLDPNDPEPTIDRFLDKPDPYAALAVEAGKWAVREERRGQQQQFQQTQVQQAQAELAEREAEFTQTHPDYLEHVNRLISTRQFHPAVLNAMADDDLGPAVAYHLATHLDEAQRIALLTPVAGVKEIGKLSSRLTPASVGSGTPAVSTSRAKPLIKPVSGSPVAPESKPPEELPFGPKYIREMNAKERREREGRYGA